MPAWDSRPGPSRYLHIPEIDRWRAAPYDMPPAPERGTVLQRVRQLTESLEEGIDEGTGASLDRLIESWTGSWIAIVEAEYTDHCGVLQVLRGQALEWLTESTRTARQARMDYSEVRADYLACKRRLTGEPVTSSGTFGELSPDGPDVPGEPAGRDVPAGHPDRELARAGAGPAHTQARRGADVDEPGWVSPHLVAGRSTAALAAAGVLILIGALTDTVAFKSTLELVLRTATPVMSWLMAVGAASMGLVAAGSLGVALAINRRGTYRPPRHRPPRVPLIGAAIVWLGLGLAMFLVRWLDTSNTAAPSVGPSHPAHQPPGIWIAVFFAAIYLISGACTLFEAERFYNPEYFAFLRLGTRYREQAARLAAADATVDRARSALDGHDGELDREEQRRVAAIAERQALGAEAANHARVLMAAILGDPAKTGLTETGPVPEVPSSRGPGPMGGDHADAAA
jgi:hypothetical protein